ncbi:MAG: universal stress protein [Candidatus Sulfobium sp.]|jgi:nucleotide-binding universal stress UspA family protein
MKGYRKILIAVNGSKDTLTQGLRLAHNEKCWVTVVKVLPPYDGDLELVGIKNLDDVLNGDAGKELQEIRKVADSERSLVKTRLERGQIHEKIVEVAEDERCDLIVMGAHKKTLLERIFSPRIVERVISRAPCPVLVVGT